MKIDKIDLYPVSVPYKVIEKSSRVYRSGVSDIIIKITTDDGIVGWGEATRTASAKVIIESLEAMKPVLMNQDPWQNLKHYYYILYLFGIQFVFHFHHFDQQKQLLLHYISMNLQYLYLCPLPLLLPLLLYQIIFWSSLEFMINNTYVK